MKKSVSYLTLLPAYLLILAGFLIGAFAGSKAITVLSESAPVTNRACVIIDAGHGGEDGGATSCTGVLESKINLEIALKLDDLMHFLGVDTHMIRTTDRSIYTQGDTIATKKISDIKERVKIVNETKDALLISIHQNQFSDSRYKGAQVFYAPTDKSNSLAKEFQTQLIQSLNPGSKRQIKNTDGIYLMQHINCPGVLIECGFLSNPEEEAMLRDNTYQKKICVVIASVTSRYLNNREAFA